MTHTLPQLFLPLGYILQVSIINPPGLMHFTRLFFDMIDRRCRKEGPNCMIFTSNLTPDKWRDFFREEDSLLCALDRTFDAATVYLMKGESYRGRNLKTYSIEISDPTE